MMFGVDAVGWLYRMHGTSIFLWLAAASYEMRRQKSRLPSEWDFFGVRFFVAYTLFDAIRSSDLCVDSSDGVCFAVWGVCPLWIRMASWWARDALLFAAVSFYFRFALGWVHAVLERPIPRGFCIALYGTTLATIVGLAGCFVGLLTTNRQSWQALSGFCVVLLNIPWSFLNLHLLLRFLPEVSDKMNFQALRDRATQTSGDTTAPSLLAEGTYTKARLASWLISGVNVAILVFFPLMALERIFSRNAHNMAVIPSVQLGMWAGYAHFPHMSTVPAETSLDPLLEIVELGIGWAQCVQCLATSFADEDFHAMLEKSAGDVSYVSRERLGIAFRKLVDKAD